MDLKGSLVGFPVVVNFIKLSEGSSVVILDLFSVSLMELEKVLVSLSLGGKESGKLVELALEVTSVVNS